MFRGYKYRIYPNCAQAALLNQMFGNARFVFNWALTMNLNNLQTEQRILSPFLIMKELTRLKEKPGYEWLNVSVIQSLQQSIVNLSNAFKRFQKKKSGFPKFKSWHNPRCRVGFPQNTRIDFNGNKISVLKLGWIKARISRRFNGIIKSSVIEKTPAGKYFISLTVEFPNPNVKQKAINPSTSVGIDTGMKTFATFSDGRIIENPRHMHAHRKRLSILHRRVNSKNIGSANRIKARRVLAVLHSKIANRRTDFLHKVTTDLARNYETVVCEDLDLPGIIQKPYFSKGFSDLGLGLFYVLLKYKVEQRGGNFIKIGRFKPSSKMCYCGHIEQGLKLSERKWTCKQCGSVNERDLLAAKNILKYGLSKY